MNTTDEMAVAVLDAKWWDLVEQHPELSRAAWRTVGAYQLSELEYMEALVFECQTLVEEAYA